MSADRREKLTVFLLQYTTPILFIAIFLFFGLPSSRFINSQNIQNIIKQASFIGIVAVGMTFVLLSAGMICPLVDHVPVSADRWTVYSRLSHWRIPSVGDGGYWLVSCSACLMPSLSSN